jgi:uncharacterized membrane protein
MEYNGTISGGNNPLFTKKNLVILVICILLVWWSKFFALVLLYLGVGYGLIYKRDGKDAADSMGISLLWWPKIYFNDND